MQRGVRYLSIFARCAKKDWCLPVRRKFFLNYYQRCHFISTMSYVTIERGAPNTTDYRMYFSGSDGLLISPFHDIPLYADREQKIFNMVVEVPRWTNAKMEINTKEKLNPIKQDIKKGKLRYINNCFPHHGYIWNYGALPQTWEDPNHIDVHTQQKGDNDPIDVCEIGSKVHKRGAVVQVKVLGCMALIDEGETDWKLIAIDVKDPLAAQLNDIENVEEHMPGLLRATYEWFRIYKIPTGKPPNEFAFHGEAKPKAFALEIVGQTHEQWQKLVNGSAESGGLEAANTSLLDTPHNISQSDAEAVVNAAPPLGEAAAIDDEVDKISFVRL